MAVPVSRLTGARRNRAWLRASGETCRAIAEDRMRPSRNILLPLAVLAGLAAAPACVPLALQGAGQILSSIAQLSDFSSAFNSQRLLDR